MRGKADALKDVPMFQGIDEASLRGIAGLCTIRDYGPGELVIGERDVSFDVLILLEGEARVSLYSRDGQRVAFHDIGAGSVLGEISAIDGAPRSASVEAVSDCSMAVLPRRHFLALMESNSGFALAVSRKLAGDVRRLTTRVFEFSTMAVRYRLHAELLRLGEEKADGATSALISPMPTSSDLASRISTHREAVSREMARLNDKGVAVKQGRTLYIPSLPKLRELMEESWEH